MGLERPAGLHPELRGLCSGCLTMLQAPWEVTKLARDKVSFPCWKSHTGCCAERTLGLGEAGGKKIGYEAHVIQVRAKGGPERVAD